MLDQKIISLLRIHDACQGLSDSDVDLIASLGEVVHVDTGESICRSGQQLDSLYLVILGRLKMSIKSPGGIRRTIRYIATGDQFGALILVADEASPVDIEVDEKAILLRFDRDVASRLGEQFPLFRRNLLRKLGLAVRDSMMKQHKRSPSKVVAFLRADEQTESVVSEIANRLVRAGEKVGVMSDSVTSSFDPSIPIAPLIDENGEYVGEPEVRGFVGQWSDLTRFLIIVGRLYPVEKLMRLVELSDSVFYVSTTDQIESTVNEMNFLISQTPSWQKKNHLVWVLGEQEQVAPSVSELPKLVDRDFKVKSTNAPEFRSLYDQGIDRIVHYLRGVSIGLALSGGAARGMTHLGVLKALDEAGITIDKLAGTSAGVLTGVIYCAGFSPQWGIDHFTNDLEPGSFYKHIPKGEDLYMLMKYRSKSWDQMLRKYLLDWGLEQLPLPCTTVTGDLVSAKSIERTSGDSVHSILESINLPVLSAPICRDGMLLVDGGILNNLPADVLVKQGCNFVIGIDVSAIIEHRVGNNLPDTPTKEMKSPNSITTMLRWLNVQAHNMSSLGAESADVIIAPDVSGFDSAAFTRTPEMSEIGYQATMDSMPRIREILNNLDSGLFNS